MKYLGFFIFALLISGQSILEDFHTDRNQPVSGMPLWSVYTGAGNGCPGQTGAVNTGTQRYVATISNDCMYVQFVPYPYDAATGFIQSYIESGVWNAQNNRFTYDALCATHTWALGVNPGNLGTYIRENDGLGPGNQGQHYYHEWAGANYDITEWMHITMNRKPFHRVGVPAANLPDDPEWVWPTGVNPVHYYDGMTRFYIATQGVFDQTGNCYLKNLRVNLVTGEPDEAVSSLTEQYNNSTGKYYVAWHSAQGVQDAFAVHYSTSDMKSIGFSNGTATADVNTGDSYVSWTSPSLAKGNYYVAIRPKLTIGSATNTSPIVVSTANALGVSTGDQVVISSAQGNTAANGTWTVINIPRVSWFDSTGVANQFLTSIVVSGHTTDPSGTITVNLSVNHNLQVGQAISILNTTGSIGDWNGSGNGYLVASTPTAQSFTVANYGVANGTYDGSSGLALIVWSLPAISLNGSTGNGTYVNNNAFGFGCGYPNSSACGIVSATSDTSEFTQIQITDGSTDGGTSSGGALLMSGKVSTN